MTRHRILLLIPHLGGGGAEQVTTLLAQNLSAKKYDLHLGLITQSRNDADHLPLPIQVHALGARRIRGAALPLLRLVWRLRPNVIFSGMAHLNFLVLLLRPFFPPGTRVLVRQNGTVSSALAAGNLPIWTRLLYRILYRRADWVICQSGAMARDLVAVTGTPPKKLAVLPNPVDAVAIRTLIEASCPPNFDPGPHLVAVGRLAREKGFDLLLDALAAVRRRYPTAHLTIAGAGAELTHLKAHCRSLLLDNAVRFAGRVNHPARLFSGASLFVLSSRYEGLPNALLEAAAAGLPIAALPSSQGIIDLLQSKSGVFLAGQISAEALAGCILQCLETIRPGDRFQHAWLDEFQLDQAVPVYESLIDAALAEECA